MSKFRTLIPVDIATLKKMLPDGATVHLVGWDYDLDQVHIDWEHDDFVTPFDHAIPFTTEALERQELPDGVRHRAQIQHEQRRAEALANRENGEAKVQLTHQQLATQFAAEDRELAELLARAEADQLTAEDALVMNSPNVKVEVNAAEPAAQPPEPPREQEPDVRTEPPKPVVKPKAAVAKGKAVK